MVPRFQPRISQAITCGDSQQYDHTALKHLTRQAFDEAFEPLHAEDHRASDVIHNTRNFNKIHLPFIAMKLQSRLTHL